MNARQLEKMRPRLYSRMPIIGPWLRRRAARQLAGQLNAGSARLLAETIASQHDPQVAGIASDALTGLKEPAAAIDAVAAVWAETRHPQLERLLCQCEWMASKPPAVHVLTGLKLGRWETIAGQGATIVPALVDAAEDADAKIAGLARQALQHLKRRTAREALCQLVIEQDSPPARQAALAAGYLPEDGRQRALFYFLTEQWAEYEAIDFDRSILRAAYEAADEDLRRRMMDRLRRAGRIDYLTVIAGGDYRSRATTMTANEVEFLITVLAERHAWNRLWSLTLQLAPAFAARIIDILAAQGWQPERQDERHLFEELLALYEPVLSLAPGEARRLLPPAVLRARARVPGRINALAFSPTRPVLAVGTGQRKLVIWDYRQGRRERVLDEVAHSISQVTFSRDLLLCAERSHSDTVCNIYGWENGQQVFCLGSHRGPVTALEALADQQLLTTGRDGRAVIWDLSLRKIVAENRFDFWPRAASLSPDGQLAALVHHGVTVIGLPELQALGHARGAGQRGVVRCAAFAPESQTVIVGRYNGQVVAIPITRPPQAARHSHLIGQHSGHVQAISIVPGRQLFVSAGSDGSLHFTPLPGNENEPGHPLGAVKIDGQSLTSLHLSPDGSTMAVGDAGANLWLWDLRVLSVPELFENPLARAAPLHLAAIDSLEADGHLPANVQQALTFIKRLLQFRFRYEIDIDALPTIKMGEFDIELE